MCKVTHYRDFHCKHRWATIAEPCGLGMGFDVCPTFISGQVKPLPPRLVAKGEACPKCDLDNVYNRNQTRMVRRIRYGFRWGLGPNKTDPGCDVVCCCVM